MSAAPPAEQMSGGAYLRLVVLGGAIGIPAALVAAFFLAFVHDAEDWLWHDLPDALGYDAPPWFLVIGLPLAGAAIVLVGTALPPGRRRPLADRGPEHAPHAGLRRPRHRDRGARHALLRRRPRPRDARGRARLRRRRGRDAPRPPRAAGDGGPLDRGLLLRDLCALRRPDRGRDAARRGRPRHGNHAAARAHPRLRRRRRRLPDLHRLRRLGRPRSPGPRRPEPAALRRDARVRPPGRRRGRRARRRGRGRGAQDRDARRSGSGSAAG